MSNGLDISNFKQINKQIIIEIAKTVMVLLTCSFER